MKGKHLLQQVRSWRQRGKKGRSNAVTLHKCQQLLTKEGPDIDKPSGLCPVHSTQSTTGIWSSFRIGSSPKYHESKEWQRGNSPISVCLCLCESWVFVMIPELHQCVCCTVLRCTTLCCVAARSVCRWHDSMKSVVFSIAKKGKKKSFCGFNSLIKLWIYSFDGPCTLFVKLFTIFCSEGSNDSC